MNRIHYSIWTAGTLGLMLATIGGCADMQRRQEAFFPAQEARSVDAVAQAQADNGALRDGMLRPIHFDGNELNALGRRKLDRMRLAAASSGLTVFLDLPRTDKTTTARHHAVVAYLQDQGLTESQFAVRDGINPAVLSSAEEGLIRLPKTESSGAGDDYKENQSSATGLLLPGQMMATP